MGYIRKLDWPPTEFDCKQCGKRVTTRGGLDEKLDKRTVFCSRECEVKYWKHAYRRKGGLE